MAIRHETTINAAANNRAMPIYHEIILQFISFYLNDGKGIFPYIIYQYNNFYICIDKINRDLK